MDTAAASRTFSDQLDEFVEKMKDHRDYIAQVISTSNNNATTAVKKFGQNAGLMKLINFFADAIQNFIRKTTNYTINTHTTIKMVLLLVYESESKHATTNPKLKPINPVYAWAHSVYMARRWNKIVTNKKNSNFIGPGWNKKGNDEYKAQKAKESRQRRL